MGHYASEMMCQDCGRTICRCQHTPSLPNLNWMVDVYNDMAIKTVDQFDKDHASVKTKYGLMPGMPLIKRMNCKEFKKKSDAESHAVELLEGQLANAKAEVEKIEKMLHERTVTKLRGKK
jgi:hypothetical protein